MLAHTKWLCRYLIVFTPKYRRRAICNQHRRDLGGDPQAAAHVEGGGDHRGAPHAGPRPHAGQHPAEAQRLELHGLPEGQELPAHVRPAREPQVQVREQEVPGRGYYVSTVGLNESTIRKYIREQESADIALDRLSVKEYEDPFAGR